MQLNVSTGQDVNIPPRGLTDTPHMGYTEPMQPSPLVRHVYPLRYGNLRIQTFASNGYKYEIEVRWNPDTGKMIPHIPPPQEDGEEYWWLTVPEALNNARRSVRVHADLCRRSVNHPADHGLTAHQWPSEGTRKPIELTPGSTYIYNEPQPAEPVTLPPAEVDTMWLAENTTPDRFGTLYVAASCKVRDGIFRTRWVLGAVGTRTVLAEADWDDEEVCTALFDRVKESAENREALMVAVALMANPDEFADDRKRANLRVDRLAADADFTHPRDRIKPRLIERAVKTVLPEILTTSWMRNNAARIKVEKVTIPSPGAGAGKNVAAKIIFNKRNGWVEIAVPDDISARWAEYLQNRLNERELGHVFRYTTSEGATILMVVKNPQLAFAHGPALGLPEGTHIYRHVPPKRGDAASWELFTTITHPNLLD